MIEPALMLTAEIMNVAVVAFCLSIFEMGARPK